MNVIGNKIALPLNFMRVEYFSVALRATCTFRAFNLFGYYGKYEVDEPESWGKLKPTSHLALISVVYLLH